MAIVCECGFCHGRPHDREVHRRGGRIGSHKDKVRAGRKAAEYFKLHPELARERGRRGGRIQGRKNVESGHIARLGRSQGRKNVENGHLVCIASKGGYIGGPIGGRRYIELYGNPATPEGRAKGGRIATEKLRQKPNRDEGTVAALLHTFAPDVFVDTVWWRAVPSEFRGVPDLRHPVGIIGEYDGGGHHVFQDRHADDAAKDAERCAMGYVTIRETDPFIFMTKFAYAVRRELVDC